MRIKWIEILLVALLFSAGCRRDEAEREAPQEVARVSAAGDFYQEAKRAGKLEFGSLKLTKTVTTERTAWYKVGSRVAAYSYDIWLRAYVDLDELEEEDVKVDEEKGIVTLTLPPVEVEVAGRSAELRKEYENIGIFRSRPDSRERAELKEIADADFAKEMKGNPEYVRQLRETAGRKARAWFTALGESRGYRVEFSEPLSIYKDRK